MEAQTFTFASSSFVPIAIGFFWPGHWLLHLGWSGPVWISESQPGSKPKPGFMGLLDARVHAISHRHLSIDRADVV